MPTIYHYTTEDAWKKAKLEGVLTPSVSILRPGQGGNLPQEAYQKTILAFLEKIPKEWINNKCFHGLWYQTLGEITRGHDLVLLSFKPKKDEAYVLDRGELEEKQYEEANLGMISHDDMREACKDYIDSKVSLDNYRGGFVLPEVRIWTPVQAKRIKREWQKPLKKVLEESKR